MPAFDFIDKLIATFKWLKITGDPGELAGSSSLFLMDVIKICPGRDGFTVGNLWLASHHLHFIFSLHPFNVNIQVKFPHALNNHLT